MSQHAQPSLPSLTVAALLVPLPFSSWVVRHSDVEAAAQPTWMDDHQRVDDRRPYLNLPDHDALAEPLPFPGPAENTTTHEFSFRAAWELTRSLESLPPAWRHVYRKWNSVLSNEHDLPMSAGGAHRYATIAESTVRTPPRPPAPATIALGLSTPSAANAMRVRLHRRLGIVRCPRTNQFARDPDSSWTSHGPLDRRIRWAAPS